MHLWPRFLLLLGVAAVCGLSVLLAATPESTPAGGTSRTTVGTPRSADSTPRTTGNRSRPGDTVAADGTPRLREGTKLVDQAGTFKLQGDGLTFYQADGTHNFSVLQNLAMERVSRLVGESPDTLEWNVAGVITECRGANYLLLTQATIKAKPASARAR